MTVELRPYQLRAVDSVRHLIRDGSRAPLLVAPTGAGKTVILAHVVASAIKKGRRVHVVAHRAELVDQIVTAIKRTGYDPGIIAPWARPNPFAAVQVASVQTLARREGMQPTDFLIVDEAHHVQPGNTWGRVVDILRPKHVLGLTATPIRTDGKGLGVAAGGIFDALEVVTTTAELVESGYLARPVVYAPSVAANLEGVKIERGDYAKAGAEDAMGKPAIIGNAVEHYHRLCNGARAVAFCVSIKHAEKVSDAFNAYGFPAEVIDGTLQRDDRAAMLARFASGTTRILVSCDLIGEGFDLPAIEAAILLRPTISTGLYLQQVGRALRPADGKTRAIILDHAGNTMRHGLPTDEREWSLMGDDRKAKKKRQGDPDDIPVWQCMKCYAYSERAQLACIACGELKPYAGREVEEKHGELVEITSVQKPKDRERGRARTLEELQRIERERGYKRGWASHVFNARMMKGR